MTALANRLEFVLLFDVTNGNPTATPIWATCRVSTRKRGSASSLMFA